MGVFLYSKSELPGQNLQENQSTIITALQKGCKPEVAVLSYCCLKVSAPTASLQKILDNTRSMVRSNKYYRTNLFWVKTSYIHLYILLLDIRLTGLQISLQKKRHNVPTCYRLRNTKNFDSKRERFVLNPYLVSKSSLKWYHLFINRDLFKKYPMVYGNNKRWQTFSKPT